MNNFFFRSLSLDLHRLTCSSHSRDICVALSKSVLSHFVLWLCFYTPQEVGYILYIVKGITHTKMNIFSSYVQRNFVPWRNFLSFSLLFSLLRTMRIFLVDPEYGSSECFFLWVKSALRIAHTVQELSCALSIPSVTKANRQLSCELSTQAGQLKVPESFMLLLFFI